MADQLSTPDPIAERADALFAAGQATRELDANYLVRGKTGALRELERAKVLRYLAAYDRTFCRQKAEREARAWAELETARANARRAA